jgi:hypothetical protein
MENSHKQYLDDLLRAAAETLKLDANEIQTRGRDRELVDARRILLHIAFTNGEYKFSSEALGEYIGRSRSNTEFLINTAEDFLKSNKGFQRMYLAVQNNIDTLIYNHIPQL